MAFVFWLIFLVLIIANGWNTALWIFLIGTSVLLLASVSSGKQKNQRMKDMAEGRAANRIDHPHYIDLDDHECPFCGKRFRQDVMVCPDCGARFMGTVEDDEEFTEEMELWDEDE